MCRRNYKKIKSKDVACSKVDRDHHWLGNCSFCQVTAWTAPMQAHACLRVLELAKGNPRTHGVQEGGENYEKK
jgi:hypothetical protein